MSWEEVCSQSCSCCSCCSSCRLWRCRGIQNSMMNHCSQHHSRSWRRFCSHSSPCCDETNLQDHRVHCWFVGTVHWRIIILDSLGCFYKNSRTEYFQKIIFYKFNLNSLVPVQRTVLMISLSTRIKV